ncbi:MAG TPA: hypothetical protein VMH89_14295 [Candidatus Acidoferrum sp.]|nr:hypothetical protein [Candidatus Acidoferrum sp.]
MGSVDEMNQNRRRSERVLLQMRVMVTADLEPGKPVRLEAFTLVVNAHGGLLEMGLKAWKGQKLLVSNPAAKAEETATVVAVSSGQEGNYAVAFEFNRPSPQFWPITFPPKDWDLVETKG